MPRKMKNTVPLADGELGEEDAGYWSKQQCPGECGEGRNVSESSESLMMVAHLRSRD